jgi:hypothetical protein
MCVIVLAVRTGLVDAGVHELPRLLLSIAAGALVFVPLCMWRAPELTDELRTLIERRRGVSAPPLVAAPAES